MDEIDQTQEREEHMLAARIEAARRAAADGPQASGECHFCGEAVADGRRWCDAECRDLWQRQARRGRA